MRYAAIQGVVVAWWYRAMRGSTLADLHWDWRSGTTLRGAFTAGRHMGMLGLACIFSTIVVIDGKQVSYSVHLTKLLNDLNVSSNHIFVRQAHCYNDLRRLSLPRKLAMLFLLTSLLHQRSPGCIPAHGYLPLLYRRITKACHG